VFVRHDREDLSRFASGSVDFLSCLLVLQHLPSRYAIEGYLREFVRLLSPAASRWCSYPCACRLWTTIRTCRCACAVSGCFERSA
jgi:Methyltransferase domain